MTTEGTPRIQPFRRPGPPGTVIPFQNFVLERVQHLASAALPAAGAFTSQALEALPLGTKRAAFWVTYTRGAAGGFPIFHVEFSNGTETSSRDVIIEPSIVITDPNGRFNIPLSEPAGAIPADNNPIEYAVQFDSLPPGIIGIRLLAAEAGVPATPGTIAIALTADG